MWDLSSRLAQADSEMGTVTAAEGTHCLLEWRRRGVQAMSAALAGNQGASIAAVGTAIRDCKGHAVWVELQSSSLCPLLQRGQPPGTAMAWT